MSAAASPLTNPAVTAVPGQIVSKGRYALVLFGVVLGLASGFPSLFNASLPFFLVPLTQEFGWSRGDISAAAVLAMLGLTVASPFAGRLFDRFGAERVISVSVVLFAAGSYAMSLLPASLPAFAALCFFIGLAGSGTSMLGYITVLSQWFDRRLGLALGFAGLGIGLGVGLAPFIATQLIGEVGWRHAYVALAAIALGAGLLACLLVKPPKAGLPAPASSTRQASGSAADAIDDEGLTLKQALHEARFWLLIAVTFLIAFSILGLALHNAALYLDRGLTPQQAATGGALAGLGAIAARLGVGALLDRFHAPRIAAVVFFAGAVSLFINSSGNIPAVLYAATCLGGAAMGAEGDLLPFFVRRYFGIRSFGAVFGAMHGAFALGGVLGPISYGIAYDRLHSYGPLMNACSIVCAACAAAVAWLGPYRYHAKRSDM